MKIKMRTKIVGGLMLIFVLSMVLAFYNFTTIQRIYNLTHELEEFTVINDDVQRIVREHVDWRYEITASFLYGSEFTLGLDPHICSFAEWKEYVLPELNVSDTLRSIVGNIEVLHDSTYYSAERALNMRALGQTQEATALLFSEVLEHGNLYLDQLESLLAYFSGAHYETRNEINTYVDSAYFILIFISVANFLVLAILSYFLILSLLKPIKRLVALASEALQGKTNINKSEEGLANDEIGALTLNMYELTDTLNNLIGEFHTLNNEIHVKGNTDYRADPSKYQGAFREFCEGINRFADVSANDLTTLFEILNALGDGKFDVKMRELPGNKAVLISKAQEVVTALKSVQNEVTFLVQSVTEGDLNKKIDSKDYRGEWAELVNSLNGLVGAVAEPATAIMGMMKTLQEGDFRNYVNLDAYAGVYREMTVSLNATIDFIASYINEIKDILQDLADGDLRGKIDRNYVGSFDLIKRSVNTILGQLNKTLKDIEQVASDVSAGAAHLSINSMTLSSGVAHQLHSMQELSVGISSVDNQSRENAKNAELASELASKSKENAEIGNEDMKKMLSSMRRIENSSYKISQILRTIEDIAFQTNLLALNASVEAARAGEHGRGFAVVAEEVRNLANKSGEAAKQTSSLIVESISSVKEGMERADDAARSLDRIVVDALDVSNVIGEIRTASHQQTESISDINKSLKEINNIAIEANVASKETATAANQLDALVEVLRSKLGFFQTKVSTFPPVNRLLSELPVTVTDLKLLNSVAGERLTPQDGEIIVSEGEEHSNALYFVLEGMVDVYRAYKKVNESRLAILKPGEIFGEMAVILDEPRSATIVARAGTVLLEVRREDLLKFMEAHPQISYAITKTLCLRLRAMLSDLGLY